ncbi:MAG: LysM peptidoglycan-binding domain-containing protein [Bacteroidaceae bacterium]|nr:LysM peptidoglycan-binding domain-containing protein [Bacteroidaceae bacterium]
MKIFRELCLTFLFAFIWSMQVQAQENQTYIIHTIQKGQSLYSISNMYGTTVDAIVKLNPGSDQIIVEGRQLKVPRPDEITAEGTYHTIQQGETLYGLGQKYKVSVKSILDANPGLNEKNFRFGQVVNIPKSNAEKATDTTKETTEVQANTIDNPKAQQGIPGPVQSRCKEMHKVARKETIYSIARMYGISEQELLDANPEISNAKKLKKGKLLCIPYPKAKQNEQPKEEKIPTNAELFNENKVADHNISVIKAAVILPLVPNEKSKAESARMLEYYQGFLMAVDSLKRTGTSIDLYTYDSGSTVESVNAILAKPEMRSMHIIFGPLYTEQIKPMADFASKNHIRLVIPFTSRDNTVYRNPEIYQINTPQSYLYSEVYEHFMRQFPRAHVIFLDATNGAEDKAEFIKGFREELTSKKMPFTNLSEDATSEQMLAVVQKDKANVFVPTSGSNTVLIKTLPQLTAMVNDSLYKENINAEVHLFGYPEWQTYTKDHLSAFFDLDTYFYTSFYTNNLLAAPRKFNVNYRHWYGKDMEDRYPKYGMLGFDTGYFFLKGLALYGSGLENNLQKMRLTPIQTGFKFERVNNWGGFINKKAFFVRFTPNFELIKLDFDQ